MSKTDANAPVAFIDLAAQRAALGGRIDAAIARVLDHGGFIMGPEVEAFEAGLCAFSRARHAVTCANGTDAITLVLMAEGIGPGDAVFVPAFTFVATAEAVAAQRATPVFVDVNPDTFNMDPASLERAIAHASAEGLAPRMVIAVDLFGLPAGYAALSAITDAHGLTLVADAAQSFGATSGGKTVGTLARYTTTSFFPAKPLGCYGDGGAVFTDDDDAAGLLRSLRFHGKGGDKYENVRVGLNSRLDTLQAAILIEKLKIFPGEIEARNAAAGRYAQALAGLAETPQVPGGMTCVWAQYTLRLPENLPRDRVQAAAKRAGVPAAVYYPIPLHLQAGYCRFPRDPDGLAVSEALSARVLSLPMHPYLDARTQDRICDVFRSALSEVA